MFRFIFHPIVFTAVLVALPLATHLIFREEALFGGAGDMALAFLYVTLLSTTLSLLRRDYRHSGVLRGYLVVQYVAIAQFFVVFAIDASIQDSWMLATLVLALPLMLIGLAGSSIAYLLHRALRARKRGERLRLKDVAGNASVLGGLLVLVGIVALLA